MKYFILMIILVNYISAENLSEFVLYFDPDTKLDTVVEKELSDRPNGAIIGIRIGTTSKTAFCVDYTKAAAASVVVCKQLSYTGVAPNGSQPTLALSVSSGKSTSINTNYVIRSCTGTDCVVEKRLPADYQCGNHVKDLHVMCSNKYVQRQDPNCGKQGSCTVKRTNGFTQIVVGTTPYYLCGRNRNFGSNEANALCRLLNEPSTNGRTVERIGSSNGEIGGFIAMSCDVNVTDLSKCQNVYPLDSQLCVPEDSINVLCDNTVTVTEVPKPTIQCNSTNVVVTWNDTAGYYNVTSKKPCTDYSITNSSTQFQITLGLGCLISTSGNQSDIIYEYQVTRAYQAVNSKIIRDDDFYIIHCIMYRFSNSSNGVIHIKESAGKPGEGKIDLELKIDIYETSSNILINNERIRVNTAVYAIVRYVAPSPHIWMIINRCYFGGGTSASQNLILNKCPIGSDVKIQFQSPTEARINFLAYKIIDSNYATLKCDTEACSNNCNSACVN